MAHAWSSKAWSPFYHTRRFMGLVSLYSAWFNNTKRLAFVELAPLPIVVVDVCGYARAPRYQTHSTAPYRHWALAHASFSTQVPLLTKSLRISTTPTSSQRKCSSHFVHIFAELWELWFLFSAISLWLGFLWLILFYCD